MSYHKDIAEENLATTSAIVSRIELVDPEGVAKVRECIKDKDSNFLYIAYVQLAKSLPSSAEAVNADATEKQKAIVGVIILEEMLKRNDTVSMILNKTYELNKNRTKTKTSNQAQ